MVPVDLALQLGQELEAPVGRVDEDAAAVVRIGGALDQRFADHPVDELGQCRRIHLQLLGDLAHRVALAISEHAEDAPVIGGDAVAAEGPIEPLADDATSALEQQAEVGVESIHAVLL